MILGVITARGGSKGLPRKNVLPLGGMPMIVHTIRAAEESTLLDGYLVTTDDEEIAVVAKEAGAPVPFMRPASLATDDAPHWKAVEHAIFQWERMSNTVVDTVVLLQPTSPLRLATDIDECITVFQESKANACASVVNSHHTPYFNMLELMAAKTPGILTDVTKFCVGPNVSIREAIACIDANSRGIALVVDRETVLLGTITDGDIRRFMLSDRSLDRRVSELLKLKNDPDYTDPVTASPTASITDLLRIMRKRRVRQIPVLDKLGRVVGLATQQDLSTGDLHSFARPLSDSMKKEIRRQEKTDVYATNGAVFVVKRSLVPDLVSLFELDRFVISEMPLSRSVEIDSSDDLELAEFFHQKHISASHV